MIRVQRVVSLLLICSMLLVIGLTGCGTKTASEQTSSQVATSASEPSTAPEVKQDPVKITLFTRQSPSSPDGQLFDQIVSTFNQENPDIIVVHEPVSDSTANDNKLKADFATGNVPEIMERPGIASLLELAKAGTIMDLTPVIEADKDWAAGFNDGMFDMFSLENYGLKGIYSMAWCLNIEPFYYNKDLFAKAGIDKVPETWDDFYTVVDKLKAINVIPWAVGAKNSWRIGHVHTGVTYKMLGVQAAKDLGTRTMKYTDPKVVETFKFIQDLKARGTFEDGMEGIDYDTEKALFQEGKAAMSFDGTWRLAEFMAKKPAFEIGMFPMPYFKDAPDTRYNDITYPSQFILSGKMDGAKKDAAVKFLKFFTNKDNQTAFFVNNGRFPSRKDIDTASLQLDPLVKTAYALSADIKVPGHDLFAYDPLPNMLDVVWNSLIGALIGSTADKACDEIQKEVDRNTTK